MNVLLWLCSVVAGGMLAVITTHISILNLLLMFVMVYELIARIGTKPPLLLRCGGHDVPLSVFFMTFYTLSFVLFFTSPTPALIVVALVYVSLGALFGIAVYTYKRLRHTPRWSAGRSDRAPG